MIKEISLLKDNDTILLIIDAQEKLINGVINTEEVVWNIERIIDASKVLGIGIIYSEQNPTKLGKTLNNLTSNKKVNSYSKLSFSCCDNENLMKFIESERKSNILICGVETHVCVQQTCIDLLSKGYVPHVVVDAVSSRKSIDHKISIRKLELSGVILSTTESAIFELCSTADRPEFKKISGIIKKSPPNI
tara:strand:- start:8704 stop:9276 length:573 start_codon:yes stop_codon:yes gene_type:complete